MWTILNRLESLAGMEVETSTWYSSGHPSNHIIRLGIVGTNENPDHLRMHVSSVSDEEQNIQNVYKNMTTYALHYDVTK